MFLRLPKLLNNISYLFTKENLMYTSSSRADVQISKKQEPIKIYPERSPIYVTPKRISNKKGNGHDNQIPGRGEVVIEDRFIHSRPLFSYEALNKPPENHYLPPSYSDTKPEYTHPVPLPTMPPKSPSNGNNNSDFNPPPVSYDSPYNSYNPPQRQPSYFYPKPPTNDKPSVYPPFVDTKQNSDKMKQKPSVEPPSAPYLGYDKQPEKKPLPEYLDYDPNEQKHGEDSKPSYLDHNPHEHHHNQDTNDHNHDHHIHNGNSNNSGMKPDYLDYDPHEQNHNTHGVLDSDTPNSPNKPEFPPYLYNHPPPKENMKDEDHKDSLPSGIPPYLEHNPYEHKGHEKGPPISQVVEPPSDFPYPDHYGKVPEYLDHDPHQFPDFYHFPHFYHDLKPLTTSTTTPAPEEKRVNKRPYTYYYIGRKLWYIPLYFSLYFIVYVFVLVLKSIARHKITFNQYFEDNRAMKDDDSKMESLTEQVLISIDDATHKYED